MLIISKIKRPRKPGDAIVKINVYASDKMSLILVERHAGGHLVHLAAHIGEDGGVGGKRLLLRLRELLLGSKSVHAPLAGTEHRVDKVNYVHHLERTARVERHHVFVDGDIGLHQFTLGYSARNLGELAPEVDKHKVIVGSAADHLVAKAKEFVAHGLSIGDDLLLVGHILGLLSLEEGNRLGGYHVLQRASLATGEYIRVEHLAHLLDYALGVAGS